MTRARTATTIAVVSLTFALAACGSSGSTTGTSASPEASSPTGSSTATPTHASSSPPSPLATESNPPGDIPDNQAYVTYRGSSGDYSIEVPEGWARQVKGGVVTFTDKLNSIGLDQAPAAKPPTVASTKAIDVPALKTSVPQFSLESVTTFTRPGGSGILVKYLGDSPPDPVTNKVVRDAVEQYTFWKKGQQVVVTLSGPQNADNVDPWARVTGSFRWSI